MMAMNSLFHCIPLLLTTFLLIRKTTARPLGSDYDREVSGHGFRHPSDHRLRYNHSMNGTQFMPPFRRPSLDDFRFLMDEQRDPRDRDLDRDFYRDFDRDYRRSRRKGSRHTHDSDCKHDRDRWDSRRSRHDRHDDDDDDDYECGDFFSCFDKYYHKHKTTTPAPTAAPTDAPQTDPPTPPPLIEASSIKVQDLYIGDRWLLHNELYEGSNYFVIRDISAPFTDNRLAVKEGLGNTNTIKAP